MKDLQLFFDDLNTQYFKEKLTIKKIIVVSSLQYKPILAYYDVMNQVIAFSPITLGFGNKTIRQIMHHEMCHRWMYQKGFKNPPHGDLFWDMHNKFKR